jgi:hypothetical protein
MAKPTPAGGRGTNASAHNTRPGTMTKIGHPCSPIQVSVEAAHDAVRPTTPIATRRTPRTALPRFGAGVGSSMAGHLVDIDVAHRPGEGRHGQDSMRARSDDQSRTAHSGGRSVARTVERSERSVIVPTRGRRIVTP